MGPLTYNLVMEYSFRQYTNIIFMNTLVYLLEAPSPGSEG